MSKTRRPNFFIVGAPKCGTTALYEYLRRHPKVFMPSAKEPHFFAEDFPEWRYRKTETEYLDLFAQASAEVEAVGEASPWYLYSKTALANIHAFAPTAKIIVMLRNPLELVHAQHSQNVYNFDEDKENFAVAWSLEEARRRGDSIPPRCRSVEMLYYSEIAKLGAQLERARSVFPREQIFCLRFENFISDTKTEYATVLKFLGLPLDTQSTFDRINTNRKRRFSGFARFVERPPSWLAASATRAREFLGVQDLGLYRLATALTTQRASRDPITEEMRLTISAAYRDDVRFLAEQLGEDLSAWIPQGNEGSS